MTLSPKNSRKLTNSVVLPKLTLAEQRNKLKQEGTLLAKYRKNNRHYEAKKIALDILYQVIGHSV